MKIMKNVNNRGVELKESFALKGEIDTNRRQRINITPMQPNISTIVKELSTLLCNFLWPAGEKFPAMCQ